jgi:Putative methyltransferase
MIRLRQWLRGRLSSNTWTGWPERAYQQDRYQHRLAAVQEQLADAIDRAPGGPVRIISPCAGDGRDLINVLRLHPRRDDVSAWLVEKDSRSVVEGKRRAANDGLADIVQFVSDDATDYATYRPIIRADIVLLCGVWGHVPASERTQLVCALTSFCKAGGMVIWTRGAGKGMIRLQQIQSLFASPLWQQVRANLTPDKNWAIVTHRYCGPPMELPTSGRIFHFRTGAGTT